MITRILPLKVRLGGIRSQRSLPSEGSSPCQALHTRPAVPTGTGQAPEGSAQEDGSLQAACSPAPGSPPRGRPGIPWGPSRSHGRSPSALVSGLDIWQEGWLTAGETDEVIHRAADSQRQKQACNPPTAGCPVGGGDAESRAAWRGQRWFSSSASVRQPCTPTGLPSHCHPPAVPEALIRKDRSGPPDQ